MQDVRSALMRAACLGNADIVELLLEHHADINLTDYVCHVLLILPICIISRARCWCRNCVLECYDGSSMTHFLRQIDNDQDGNTVLHLAVANAKINNTMQVVDLLLRYNASVVVQNKVITMHVFGMFFGCFTPPPEIKLKLSAISSNSFTCSAAIYL